MRRTCVVVGLVALLCMVPSEPGARAAAVRLAFVSNGDVYVREADGALVTGAGAVAASIMWRRQRAKVM